MSVINIRNNFLRSLMRSPLSLEEFTSQDIENDLREEDDNSINTLVNQELIRDIEQEDTELEYLLDPEEVFYTRSAREEEVIELAENEILRVAYDGEYELDEEDSGVQKASSEVEGILQNLSRVETNLLETDDLKCSICHSEYGKERGDTTMQLSDFDEESPDPEAPENPVMLPCGHLFGDLCIYKWLQEPRPASCPLCRYQL